MDANNVIARLYAWPRISHAAEIAIKSSGFQLGRDDAATATTPHDFFDTTDEWYCHDYILISFDKLPKTSRGLIFGHNKDSDVKLPYSPGLSGFHFSISFDDQWRLIVKDLNSTHGTQVTYGDKGKGEGLRRNFQWIVDGVDVLSSGPIVIRVHDKLSFHLVPEKHDMTKREIKAKVDAFRQGSMADQKPDSLDSLVKRQLASLRPETSQSPKTGSLYLTGFLGKGGNGMATYRWNVSTGEETVVKKPIRVLDDINRALWGQEADIMKKLRHVSLNNR